MRARTKGIVGTLDRVVRAILGAGLIGYAGFSPWMASLGGEVPLVSALAGAVLLATAAMGFCPLYRLLGISTG